MTDKQNEFVSSIRERLDRIDYENIETYTRPDLGKDFNFESAEETIIEVIEYCKLIRDCDYTILPETALQKLANGVSRLLNGLETIRIFDIKKITNNPLAHRDSAITNLNSQYGIGFTETVDVLNFMLNTKNRMSNTQSQFQEFMKNSKKEFRDGYISFMDELGKISEDAVNANKRAQEILKSMQEASSQVGVQAYAQIFDDQAKDYQIESKKWLNGVIGFGFGVLGWGILSFFIKVNTNDSGPIIQLTISKVIIFSLLVFGLGWCAKNYRALRHNVTVFNQKSNSLKIFETFVQGAKGDEETKNAILLHAAQYIFSQQATGFNTNDSDGDSQSRIIEIFKSMGSSKS